jgi:hypothetical protein
MSNAADLVPATTPEGIQVGPSAGPQADTAVEDTQAGTQVPPADPFQAGLPPKTPKEIGGPPGPEPTRYGDWQYKGRCTDF